MNFRSLRQQALGRSLYRKLLRETQRIPRNASLAHLEQRVGGTKINSRETLRLCIRSSFRRTDNTNTEDKTVGGREKDGVQEALEGLKYLLSLDLSTLVNNEAHTEGPLTQDESDKNRNHQGQQHSFSLESPISSEFLLDSVHWLPPVSEMNDVAIDSSDFPIFPLAGPLFPDDEGERLPLISQFSEVPVFGMEVPLRIFEPRYRQMYQDLLSSSDHSRSFIVPFSHPYRPGQFAEYGWMYEIVRVRDVADQSNGKYQLVCNHLVTKPVKILGIVNPTAYDTGGTYLRAHATIVENGGYTREENCSTDLQPLENLLKRLQNQPLSLSSDNNLCPVDTFLIDRLLMALGEGSIWPVVQVWISNMQTEVLRLQMKISTRIQLQATSEQKQSPENDGKSWQECVTEDMVSLAQAPYKDHLKGMLMEVSTLVPSLLQETSHKSQCQQMFERIRQRLVKGTDTTSD